MTIETRLCSKCGEEKPLTKANFYQDRSWKGFHYWCIECSRAYKRELQRKFREENPGFYLIARDHVTANDTLMNIGIEQPLDSYTNDELERIWQEKVKPAIQKRIQQDAKKAIPSASANSHSINRRRVGGYIPSYME